MTKKIILSSMIILAFSPVDSTLISQQKVSADTTLVSQSMSLEKNSKDTNNVDTTLKQELSNLAVSFSMNKFRAGDVGSDNIIWAGTAATLPWSFSQEAFAKVNNDMKLKEGDTLAAHSSDLRNDTGTQQSLSTPSFEYTSTDSVSTSTTHSTGVSMMTSAEMKFPFVAGSISMTAGYDFSTTKEVTTSTTKKWTVPSQNINVPAGRHYKVNWVLNTGVATGTTDLTSQVSAVVPYKQENGTRYGYSIGNAINSQNNLENTLPFATEWGDKAKWNVESSDKALRKWGTSQYRAECGTELIMTISDVTNSKTSPVLVKSIPMNVTPKAIK